MWVVFVIDQIVNTHGKDEYKYVRYGEYTTELECVEKAIDLYYTFQNGEEAICKYE